LKLPQPEKYLNRGVEQKSRDRDENHGMAMLAGDYFDA
jgi:hypothetical protein